MRLFLFLGMFEYKNAAFRPILTLAIGDIGSVAFFNLTLANTSVGIFQIAKLMCIPVTLLLQFIWHGKQVSTRVKISLVPFCLTVECVCLCVFVCVFVRVFDVCYCCVHRCEIGSKILN